jgi:hypothetical protein
MKHVIALMLIAASSLSSLSYADQNYELADARISATVSGLLAGYCHAKYGDAFASEEGKRCTRRGLELIKERGIKDSAKRIRTTCGAEGWKKECMNKELFKLMGGILMMFDDVGL